MKKCVFIIGCNAVGKTALARELIRRFDGISRYENQISYCNDGLTAFAGKYLDGSKYGGVDYFHETKCLEGIVSRALETHERVILEGSYMNTFGLNLQRAMFAKGVEAFLLVALSASPEVIRQRLLNRTGNVPDEKKLGYVLAKNKGAQSSADKWESIGVKVLRIDTGRMPFDKEVGAVLKEVTA